MKIIVTTSDRYEHLVPVFIFLFNRYWGSQQPVEIIGYQKPNYELPDNFTFVSLGSQSGNKKDFSNDLRKYFEKQNDYFLWFFEDSWVKTPVRFDILGLLFNLIRLDVRKIGRIELTGENQQHHTLPFHKDEVLGIQVWETPPKSDYRLSTQPAIWNKEYLLRYLTPNLSPWDFECQDKVEDEFHNVGLTREDAPISHNEGVTRHDIFKLNLSGVDENIIQEMKDEGIIPNETVAQWNPPADRIRAYLKVCKEASESEEVFNRFKSHPDYNYVLEHTSQRLGEEYLKQGIFFNIKCLENDDYGMPTKHKIGPYFCSPTTMQYMSIACRIVREKLHNILENRIVEIGGGYGGQCKILNDLINVAQYDIVDLPEVNLLQKKYLYNFPIIYAIYNSDNYPKDKEWDLVIANYSLSEVEEPLQTEYVKNICLKSKHGYITSNGKIHSMDLIKEKFSDTFKISKDIEGEVESNFILTW